MKTILLLNALLIAGLSSTVLAQEKNKLSDRISCKYNVYTYDLVTKKYELAEEGSVPVLTEDQTSINFVMMPTKNSPSLFIMYSAAGDSLSINMTDENNHISADGALLPMKGTGGYFTSEYSKKIEESLKSILTVSCLKNVK